MKCVVIGASHAAAQFVVSLRQGGWAGEIMLIGDEDSLPYHRPPLSKAYLSGKKELSDILIRPSEAYIKANVTLKLGTRVVRIDRNRKVVKTEEDEIIAYDKLVLATGARVRALPIDGAEGDNVLYLRNFVDVENIKSKISRDRRALVIGGGYIGLETAASLRSKGMQVTVLEAMDRILQRVTAPIMSQFFKRIHEEEGVTIIENEMALSISHENTEMAVHTKSGSKYLTDLIIIGVGVIPNIELAEQAGLAVSNGIEVNPYCQTSDPDIYSIGDVTWHHNPLYNRFLRLESVPNATEQAKIAALHLNGTEKAYESLPWFWSDQYDLKLQIAGLSEGYDDIVVRGDPETTRSFSVFYFLGDKLLAIDAVNSPREFMMGKSIIKTQKKLNKSLLSDITVSLKSLIEL